VVRMRALHFVARAALRLFPPRRAREVVAQAARSLPALDSTDEARRLADALDASGTCLSRALTVSAVLPGSEVVIGVDPGDTRTLLLAHAWVEVGGTPLRASDPRGQEIARL